MDTRLIPEIQIAQHAQLVKILGMMALCERYIAGDKKHLQSDICRALGGLHQSTQQRIEFRLKVLRRLEKYYAKKLFQLTSGTYSAMNAVPEKAKSGL